MQYMFSHTTGKRIPMDEEMRELRKRLLPAFGYVIRLCTIGPCFGKPLGPRMCIEREAIDCEMNGVMCSGHHAVFDESEGGEWHWPEEVQKAAHAIDKSKPKKPAK